jgi:hypothetical protein
VLRAIPATIERINLLRVRRSLFCCHLLKKFGDELVLGIAAENCPVNRLKEIKYLTAAYKE